MNPNESDSFIRLDMSEYQQEHEVRTQLIAH